MSESRRLFVRNVYWVHEFVPVRPTLSLRLGARSDGEEWNLPLYPSPLFTVYKFLVGELDVDVNPELKLSDTERFGPFFTPKLAEQLFDTVEMHPECLDILLNCHGGWNRSPAVASAFADVYGWEFFGWPEGERGYNHYIYRLMLEEAARRKLYTGKIPQPNLTGYPLDSLFIVD
ncbi:MAG: hypothetical protein Q7R96_03015 [Nanoarchaeota archaeon]|nr:hypothetical protein [Nanoarchaeota archaeon]